MNTELLREALRSQADLAPMDAGLLDAVRTRSGRIRRRRVVVTGAVAAATVAAAVTAPVVLWQTADQPAPPAAEVAEDPAGDTLVTPSYALPDFPFTPGWVPDGLGEGRYSYSHDKEYPEVTHEDLERPIRFMSVQIHSEDPGSWFAGIGFDITEQETTVRGQDALLSTGVSDEHDLPDNRVAAVSWSYEPGWWVSVLGHNGFGAEDVLQYAEELTEQPFPAQPAFTFELLPPGAELTSVDSSGMSFAPAGADLAGPRENRTSTRHQLVVSLQSGPSPYDSPHDQVCDLVVGFTDECATLAREPVQIADHDGELIGDATVVVYLEDDVSLVVTARDEFSLSREDLLRLVGGVHLTEHARPAR